MTALAVLTPIAKSHPFADRKIKVEGETRAVKIGREVAKIKAEEGNAIFDCKVLSRNHAMMWYSNGLFYIRDTKSSNGTFVNNERLSAASEESDARVIYSGDIIQLGVEIVENTNKVAHGCIYALLHLTNEAGNVVDRGSSKIEEETTLKSASRMYQMEQLLAEVEHRERQRQKKMEEMEKINSECLEYMETAWKNKVNEDRLLARIETLEAQLAAYADSTSVESVRLNMVKMIDDKAKFEAVTKDIIRKKLDEIEELQSRLNDTERSLIYGEQSLQNHKDTLAEVNKTLEDTAEKFDVQKKAYELALKTLVEKEEELGSAKEQRDDAMKCINDSGTLANLLIDHFNRDSTWNPEYDMLAKLLDTMRNSVENGFSDSSSIDASGDDLSEVPMDISIDEKENIQSNGNSLTSSPNEKEEVLAKPQPPLEDLAKKNLELSESITELQLQLADAHEEIKNLQQSLLSANTEKEYSESGEKWYTIPTNGDTRFESPAFLLSLLPSLLFFILLLAPIHDKLTESAAVEELETTKKEQ